MEQRLMGFRAFLILLSVTAVLSSAVAQSGRSGPPQAYARSDLTPGSTNPDITQDNIATTLCSKRWGTDSIRNTETTADQKETTYKIYGIPHPKNNIGANQTCELDHLVSLENGGGDGLDNIWPECGPARVPLTRRWFKLKDRVENYVHNGICLRVPNAKFSSGPKPSKPLTLAEGQAILKGDWYACYKKFIARKDCN